MNKYISLLVFITVCTQGAASEPQIPVMVPDNEIPADNYYSSANLARLAAEGERKHAPLAIIIDQKNAEASSRHKSLALTVNLAHMLQTAFVPTIVSRSIVYNYLSRRKRASEQDNFFIPENNPVSFDKWHMYEVPGSKLFLFVPDHYFNYYKGSLGLNLLKLIDISKKLHTAEGRESIRKQLNPYDLENLQLVEDEELVPDEFSIDNLRTILTTVKQAKVEQQLPIWDVSLNGHGTYKGNIGGLSPKDIQELLIFFNNELPVGLLYIQSCSAGGENLNLLEFDTTINKENVLRNLNYILIVGSITDQPTWSVILPGKDVSQLFYKFYSNAALLQGKGESLDTLLNDLNTLYRHFGSPHGSSNIPQVWLPSGLGFQTYQINKKVYIIGNVKVRVHEDEQRPIVLPDSSIVALIYPESINISLKVSPHKVELTSQTVLQEFDIRKEWKNIPNVAELLKQSPLQDLEGKDAQSDSPYPALRHIKFINIPTQEVVNNAIRLLYPEFISMLRGNSKQYFSKIELRSPEGEEKELTGVMHFIRDAFFDIGGRATEKVFFIEELIGNNDISALLELSRLKSAVADPHPLETKLEGSIGSQIKLQKITIETSKNKASLVFILDDAVWGFSFEPTKIEKEFKQGSRAYWNFDSMKISSDEAAMKFDQNKPRAAESIKQKSISESLIKRAALKASQKQK